MVVAKGPFEMNGSPRRKDILPRSSSGKAVRADCLHCGTPIVEALEVADANFCCRGCAEVYRLLSDAGLSRYYDLGGGAGHPVDALSSRTGTVDRKWLEPILARVQTLASASAAAGPAPQHRTRVVLDAQGVHCAACVWLFEKLFQKRARACAAPAGEGQQIIVNPAVGSIELTIAPDFDIAAWVGDVESFGYRLGPSLKAKDNAKQSDLVWRMGVCIAIAMNTMIFGFALYCGLSSGPVFRLFHALDFGLSLLSVIVGGSVFFRSAWQALRRRVLHLDLPIALGILLVFVSSTYTYATRGGATSYFDTLNVFIALMLVGRFLQERVIAKNKAMLLASDGAEGIYTRRVSEADSGGDSIKNVTLVRCTEIKEGDILLLGHGDVVPVESILLASENQASALFSLDWISGESAPKSFEPGAIVPAGAFSQGARAVRVKTIAPFDESTLVSLLRTSTRRDEDLARSTSWHKRLTGIYVVSVLTIAALTFVGWMIGTHGDVARTLDVVASVLIITCPCAFGIATPLAYELAQAGLRRVGLYVRTPGFLDRAAELTRVVFDKTGTLTTGELVVAEDAKRELAALSENDLNRLYALTVCSAHPKSRAIASALEHLKGSARAFNTSADVREIPGKGLELRDARTGDLYRVGARAWTLAPAVVPSIGPTQQQPHASPAPHFGDVFFTRNGEVLTSIATTEHLRTDAASEVKALKELGYDVWVLSGDEAVATRGMARAVGIPEDQAIAGHSPTKKAEWLRGGAKTLFIGDGINDSLVAEEAYCAGTPAIDRPFMASRCDFYFVTPGLRPIRQALLTARKLAQVVRRNLLIALLYNVITVLLAAAGLMTPLLCAVLMPLSSVSTVLATTAQLSLSSSRGKRDRANQNLLDAGQN